MRATPLPGPASRSPATGRTGSPGRSGPPRWPRRSGSPPRICGTLTWNRSPICPRTWIVMMTPATCSRGSRMFGRITGYVLPADRDRPVRSHRPPAPASSVEPHSQDRDARARTRRSEDGSWRPAPWSSRAGRRVSSSRWCVGQRRLVRFPIPSSGSPRRAWRRSTASPPRSVGQAGHHLEVGGDRGGIDHERLVGLGDERVRAAASSTSSVPPQAPANRTGHRRARGRHRADRRRRLSGRGAGRCLRCSN